MSSSHASKLWEEPLQGLACRVSAAAAAAVVTQSLQRGNLSSYNEKRVEVASNNAFRKIFNAYWHERVKSVAVLLLLSSCFHFVADEETVILEENAVQWKLDSMQIGKVL